MITSKQNPIVAMRDRYSSAEARQVVDDFQDIISEILIFDFRGREDYWTAIFFDETI